MIHISVVEYYDPDETEALLELKSGNMKLHAYCFPFSGICKGDNVTLFAMQTQNIGPCVNEVAPEKICDLPFAYHICAEIVDIKTNLVQTGNIKIVLDSPIDSSFSKGSLICFDVLRLDYKSQ